MSVCVCVLTEQSFDQLWWWCPLQDMCVSRMLVGSQMFQKLLAGLSEKLDGLMDLKASLRDLVDHITTVAHTGPHFD